MKLSYRQLRKSTALRLLNWMRSWTNRSLSWSSTLVLRMRWSVCGNQSLRKTMRLSVSDLKSHLLRMQWLLAVTWLLQSKALSSSTLISWNRRVKHARPRKANGGDPQVQIRNLPMLLVRKLEPHLEAKDELPSHWRERKRDQSWLKIMEILVKRKAVLSI